MARPGGLAAPVARPLSTERLSGMDTCNDTRIGPNMHLFFQYRLLMDALAMCHLCSMYSSASACREATWRLCSRRGALAPGPPGFLKIFWRRLVRHCEPYHDAQPHSRVLLHKISAAL